MGRYYTGDIEGKFWFALQSSDCANRFGKTGVTPSYLEYYYELDDLPKVEAEIKAIEDRLGQLKEKIDRFFEVNNGYNDKMLAENCISKESLSEYADLLLGYQIRDAIMENGSCQFTADLG